MFFDVIAGPLNSAAFGSVPEILAADVRMMPQKVDHCVNEKKLAFER